MNDYVVIYNEGGEVRVVVLDKDTLLGKLNKGWWGTLSSSARKH